MQPQLGWVWLSQTERIAAEQALADAGADGTRDELGFGVIHFAIADRFFPGTSVQHTSLRYVWFTCWTYLELAQRHPGGPFQLQERKAIEDRTGHRLLKHYGHKDGTGIIGGRVLREAKRSPVTKPSTVYWSAMRNWGLITPHLHNPIGLTQGELEWRWDALTNGRPRPEVDASELAPLFFDPAPMPKRWRSTDPISFDLDPAGDEAVRIRRAWASRLDAFKRPTLLSRLAERGGVPPARLASRHVLRLCRPEERNSLILAERAGALSGIARAIHVLLVQHLKDPKTAAADQARRWVDDAVNEHGGRASALDLAALRLEVPGLGLLDPLIEATQRWLRDGASDVAPLAAAYRAREIQARPGRALLAEGAVDRRDGWWPRQRSPLTYRWDKVRGFLKELDAA